MKQFPLMAACAAPLSCGGYDVGVVIGDTILGALIKGMANSSHNR